MSCLAPRTTQSTSPRSSAAPSPARTHRGCDKLPALPRESKGDTGNRSTPMSSPVCDGRRATTLWWGSHRAWPTHGREISARSWGSQCQLHPRCCPETARHLREGSLIPGAWVLLPVASQHPPDVARGGRGEGAHPGGK